MELEVLRKDMVAAMKAKDKVTKEAVSSLISAVKKVAIDALHIVWNRRQSVDLRRNW